MVKLLRKSPDPFPTWLNQVAFTEQGGGGCSFHGCEAEPHCGFAFHFSDDSELTAHLAASSQRNVHLPYYIFNDYGINSDVPSHISEIGDVSHLFFS